MPVALTDAEFNLRLARCIRQVSLQRCARDLAAVVRLHAVELLEGSDAELLYFDPDHTVLWRAHGGPDAPEGVGVLGHVAQHREGRQVLDTAAEPLFMATVDRPTASALEALLIEPVVDAFDVLQAVIVVARPREHPFGVLDQRRLAALASSVAVFIRTLGAELEAAHTQQALIAGPHDHLFNPEALEAHRGGVKVGPLVEVPRRTWRAISDSAARLFQALRVRQRLTFVQQLEASDCGAACLAMVLRQLGSELPVSSIREVMNAGPSGVSLSALLDLGGRFGLIGRAVRVQSHQFDQLKAGMVLHWEFNHLVVFEAATRDGLVVLDPAVGRRLLPHQEFAQRFTGLALEFHPDASFAPVHDHRHPTLRYLKQLFVDHPRLLRRALAASVLVQLCGAALPLLTAVVIDRVLPRANLGLLGLVSVGAVCVALFGALADFARSRALLRLRAQFDQAATFKFVAHMLALPYTFFQQRSPGDLMLRVYANSSIREILSSTVLSAALDGGMAVLYAAVLLYLAPPLAAVAFAIGALQVALVFAARRGLSELMAAEWSARSRANSKLVQVLHGIQTLKGTGAEAEGFRFWAGDFAGELNSVNKRQAYKAQLDAVTHFFQQGAPILMLCIGAMWVMHGRIPLGGMLAASTLAASFLRPLLELVRNAISLLEVKVHVERIHDVVSTPPEPCNGTAGALLTHGELEIEHLSFSYAGQDTPVIEDVSFRVSAGRSIALVGETGCGKSTLIHLILGFYACDSGAIRFDGHDSRKVNHKALRRQIGYVPQNPYLFEGSIRDNIALSHPEASLGEIVEAARIACIHDDIMAMDNGYDTRLIASGDSISGGQRQRIALARALLGKPKLLILDEATSALDTVTEARLTRNLDQLSCTRIVVAHRLSTVQQADEILVMAGGRIVESGRHEALKAKGNAYARLVGAQIEQALAA